MTPIPMPSINREDSVAEEESIDLFGEMHPYNKRFTVFTRLPETGRDHKEVLGELQYMADQENKSWQSGKCSGTMYHGGMEHYAFLNKVFSLYSFANLLQRDMCPSGTKFEGEALAMVGRMLHSDEVRKLSRRDEVAGAVTSGGTESIYNAMFVYREWGRDVKGIASPEVVAPTTIHPAHLKAAQYLGMKLVRVPVTADFEADVDAMRAHINANTVALAGSAGTYPHGVVDPISRLSDLALEYQLGLHVDGCLGGFILPWIERLGYDVPLFDFRLPGVTSISCDTHKYGYSLKGTSTINFRNKELRRYMYFAQDDFPGGIYAAPTMQGSRSAGLSAAMWAAMVCMGEEGYVHAAKAIMDTSMKIREGIARIPELRIMGKSTFLIAITSDVVDPYFINDYLHSKGWRMNGCQNPPGFHFCITLPQTQPDVPGSFLRDLADGVKFAKDPPYKVPRSGFIYGLGGSIDGREMMNLGLKGWIDATYEHGAPEEMEALPPSAPAATSPSKDGRIRFATAEWMTEFCDRLNASEAFRAAGAGWVGDFIYVVEPDAEWPRTSYLYIDLQHGFASGARPLQSLDEVKAKFTASAPLSTWRRVLEGRLDPLQGIFSNKIRLVGSLAQIQRYPKATYETIKIASSIETDFSP
jgi:sphinganine-1-phosphate aldolase